MRCYMVLLRLPKPRRHSIAGGETWTDTAGPFADRAAAERALVGALQSGVASGGQIEENEDEGDE
jgi:hypothetical protein